MKILMVCLGNICRSPLAEGILQSKLSKNFTVESRGTGGWHEGEQPDKRSIQVAKENGIDISYQKAQKLSPQDLDEFDIIYAMDKDNYRNILDMASSENASKVKTILSENPSVGRSDVPDPYYGDVDNFREVYQMLDETCTKIANNLSNEKG